MAGVARSRLRSWGAWGDVVWRGPILTRQLVSFSVGQYVDRAELRAAGAVAAGTLGRLQPQVLDDLRRDPLARQQRGDPRRVYRDRLAADAADRVVDCDHFARREERQARRRHEFGAEARARVDRRGRLLARRDRGGRALDGA